MTKEEREAIESIFKSNNYQVKTFKDWLDKEYQSSVDILLKKSSSDEVLEMKGFVRGIAYLKQFIDDASA